MTIMATDSNPYFEVSNVELYRPGPSYSIDTVKEIIKMFTHKIKIFFITGADAFLTIDTWNKNEELIKLCQFVVVTRPGYDLNKLNWHFKKYIRIIEIPALPISSTDIRKRVREGKSIKYLLPSKVEEYIFKNKLY